MIISAHQPNYLPWAGLFHKIALADMHVVYDDVEFTRYGFSNRNYIRGKGGAIMLTVPVRHKQGMALRLDQLTIEPTNKRWRRKHWEAIRNCYSSTPFYRAHAGRFKELYERDWERLVDLNTHILQLLLDALDIKRPIIRSSTLGLSGQKTDRIIDLCKKVGATSFIFGASGRKYADLNSFAQSGIEPLFQSYRLPEYPSAFRRKNSPLSVIDLLFHCGSKSFETLMQGQPTLKELRHGSGLKAQGT